MKTYRLTKCAECGRLYDRATEGECKCTTPHVISTEEAYKVTVGSEKDREKFTCDLLSDILRWRAIDCQDFFDKESKLNYITAEGRLEEEAAMTLNVFGHWLVNYTKWAPNKRQKEHAIKSGKKEIIT